MNFELLNEGMIISQIQLVLIEQFRDFFLHTPQRPNCPGPRPLRLVVGILSALGSVQFISGPVRIFIYIFVNVSFTLHKSCKKLGDLVCKPHQLGSCRISNKPY